jgi:hypothetical protein
MVDMKEYQFFLGTKVHNSAKTKTKIFQILLSSFPRLYKQNHKGWSKKTQVIFW